MTHDTNGAEGERIVEVNVGPPRLIAAPGHVPLPELPALIASHQEATEAEHHLATKACFGGSHGVVVGLDPEVVGSTLRVPPGLAVTVEGWVIEVQDGYALPLASAPADADVVLEVEDRRTGPFVSTALGVTRHTTIQRVARLVVGRLDRVTHASVVCLGRLRVVRREGRVVEATFDRANRDQVPAGPIDLSRLEVDLATQEREAAAAVERLTRLAGEVHAARSRVDRTIAQVERLEQELEALEVRRDATPAPTAVPAISLAPVPSPAPAPVPTVSVQAFAPTGGPPAHAAAPATAAQEVVGGPSSAPHRMPLGRQRRSGRAA